MPLNMKNIKTFTQWKNGSIDVTFTRGITYQKHLAQSGRSTRSAVDIFNTLICVFSKEPIRVWEIELACMNLNQGDLNQPTLLLSLFLANLPFPSLPATFHLPSFTSLFSRYKNIPSFSFIFFFSFSLTLLCHSLPFSSFFLPPLSLFSS